MRVSIIIFNSELKKKRPPKNERERERERENKSCGVRLTGYYYSRHQDMLGLFSPAIVIRNMNSRLNNQSCRLLSSPALLRLRSNKFSLIEGLRLSHCDIFIPIQPSKLNFILKHFELVICSLCSSFCWILLIFFVWN